MSAYLEEEILDWAHDKGILGAKGRGTEAGRSDTALINAAAGHAAARRTGAKRASH